MPPPRRFGIAAGGEGIGIGIVDDIDLGHGQAGTAGQFGNHGVGVGRGAAFFLPGMMHAQHQLVGVPYVNRFMPTRDDQRDHRAAAAAEIPLIP